MRIPLASAAVSLLLARAAFGQDMKAADPVEEASFPAGVSEAFSAINTSLPGLGQAPAFDSFTGDLRTFENEIPAIKPQNRLAVLRTMSASLGGEARAAQDATGETAAALDQGLADLDNAVGNWSGADDFSRRVLRTNPEDPAAWLSVSQADMGAGHAPQALAAARKSTSFAPKNPAAWRSEALAYAALGKKSLAAGAARRALSLNPADAAAKALLQILSEKNPRFHLGKITTGWDNPAAGAFPEPAGSLATPGSAAAPVFAPPKAARPAAGSGLAAPSPAPSSINGLLRDAADKIAVADYASALADAARAAEMNTQNPAAYYYQAAADNLRGRYQSAVAKATRGLAVDPADVLLRDERAWSFNRLGRVEDAVADANSALESNPQDPYAYANLGRANEQEGDIRSALADLGRAAAINPDFTAPYQEALRRYGLLPKKTGQVPPAPWKSSRDKTFLLVLASSLVGGTLLALGVLGLVRPTQAASARKFRA